MKIISLVPSITLLLCDLGLENQIIGRTKFCIHPADKVKNIPIIGGTKNIDIQKIQSLNPDLIFSAKEENTKEEILVLKKLFNVIVFEVDNLDDNYKMIKKIGKLTQKETKALQIIKQTKANFENLATSFIPTAIPTLYFIWRKPYMTVGSNTFIHSLLNAMGLKNMFEHQTRYPIIQNLRTSYFEKCKLVLLSSEPYPFSEKHIKEFQELLPQAQILLVNGEFFSWYGSKIMDAPNYFKEILSKIKH